MDESREGWLGDEYVRIYAPSLRVSVTELYDVTRFLPHYELWGSWGMDALCLAQDGKFYRIPWVPLTEASREIAYSGIEALHEALADLHEATPAYEYFAKEVHFIMPVIFGGDPNDPANIAMIDQKAHAEICCFWNGMHARMSKSDA